jgi:hypothetical protein
MHHRLVPERRQVEDCQAAVAEGNESAIDWHDFQPMIVRSTVGQCRSGRGCRLTSEVRVSCDDAGNTAHS